MLLLFLVLLAYAYLDSSKQWAERTDFHSKTLWQWMELLVVPAFIAFAAIALSEQRRSVELEVERDRSRESALQSYLDDMTELMLEKGLPGSGQEPLAREIARARTLTVLPALDGKRKGLLIRFLYQSKLIRKDNLIIDLRGADLSGVDLSGSDESENRDRTFLSYLSLSEVNLFGANLIDADLREAKLSSANLLMADLSGADLRDAHLMMADLRMATLNKAKLAGNNLVGANLLGARGTTDRQLMAAHSLKEATMPDGSKVD